ncbi:hypothetical protein [Mixta mediterraneensis]|uniref:hypothetical protein n=1 Tax=Mixta mediterraneensis TaxID=2758443 RepID=UPI001873FB56|nr:hypothetical protein [Mixta mediterraneensis]MBE5254533.1 hypothetical protein [Mixta mediterraneensis]
MAFDYETLKSAGIGLATAGSVALNGWLAFGRYWVKTRASNANDIQQIDMLDRQEKNIERLEVDNQKLRDENRECWLTIADLKGRLQVIEATMKHMERQNEELKQQVADLTAACMNLNRENVRSKQEIPR